jgi:hypothetical protein
MEPWCYIPSNKEAYDWNVLHTIVYVPIYIIRPPCFNEVQAEVSQWRKKRYLISCWGRKLMVI